MVVFIRRFFTSVTLVWLNYQQKENLVSNFLAKEGQILGSRSFFVGIKFQITRLVQFLCISR